MIPYGTQSINQDDIDAVVGVLKSTHLTQGKVVPQFELELSNYVGAKYAVAVNSATSGLHIACMALGFKTGDILWTTSLSFAASANCGLYCGGIVDFVDICPQTINLCVDALKTKLIVAEREGRLPKIIVVVHFAGLPVELREIYELSKIYKFRIIEDASHALGAQYENRKIGECLYSDLTVFSFHPVKIITTGEGGAITTNSVELNNKLLNLRSHGITRDSEQYQFKNPGDWYYEQIELGFNYRLTEIQAALGLSQMNRLDSFILKRNEIAKRYITDLSFLSIDFQNHCKLNNSIQSLSAYHLFVIKLPESVERKKFFSYMRENNIGVNVHYIPIYHHPYYRKLGFKVGYCKNAEEYYESCVSLPIFPDLTDSQYDQVIKTIKNFFL